VYTSTVHPMNVYSKLFAGKLGFKNVDIARHSVEVLDRSSQQFDLAGDRAGQHHTLSLALIMFDRARWTGKTQEAHISRAWLVAHLETPPSVVEEQATTTGARPPETDPTHSTLDKDVIVQEYG
jgi:hypothetical protein